MVRQMSFRMGCVSRLRGRVGKNKIERLDGMFVSMTA